MHTAWYDCSLPSVPLRISLLSAWSALTLSNGAPLLVCLLSARSLRFLLASNSPVIYTCFGQTRKRDVPETAVTHLCKCLEDMIVLMRGMEAEAEAPKPAADGEAKPEEKKKLSDTVKGGKWVWVVDCEDFGTLECKQASKQHPLLLF